MTIAYTGWMKTRQQVRQRLFADDGSPRQAAQGVLPTLGKLPKVDLHRHLEGSLRLQTLVEIARRYDLDVPAADVEMLRPHVQVVNGTYDHHTFLSKFNVLRRFYYSPEAIYRVAYEAVVDAARDNVRYLELRFSPQALARARNFPLDDVVEWVVAATEQASREWPIDVRLIVSLLRHEDLDLAEKVADVAFAHFSRPYSPVVGLDLAGDEVNFPAAPFQEIFGEAKKLGMGITVHAGEWTSAEAVRRAITLLGADRIGHGVRVIEDAAVLALVRERNVALEVCLTSNLHTGAVEELGRHPLQTLLAEKVMVTLNTDDPSVSNCTLTEEFRVGVDTLGLKYDSLRRLILNGVAAAFLPPARKRQLLCQMEASLPPAALNEFPTL